MRVWSTKEVGLLGILVDFFLELGRVSGEIGFGVGQERWDFI